MRGSPFATRGSPFASGGEPLCKRESPSARGRAPLHAGEPICTRGSLFACGGASGRAIAIRSSSRRPTAHGGGPAGLLIRSVGQLPGKEGLEVLKVPPARGARRRVADRAARPRAALAAAAAAAADPRLQVRPVAVAVAARRSRPAPPVRSVHRFGRARGRDGLHAAAPPRRLVWGAYDRRRRAARAGRCCPWVGRIRCKWHGRVSAPQHGSGRHWRVVSYPATRSRIPRHVVRGFGHLSGTWLRCGRDGIIPRSVSR